MYDVYANYDYIPYTYLDNFEYIYIYVYIFILCIYIYIFF